MLDPCVFQARYYCIARSCIIVAFSRSQGFDSVAMHEQREVQRYNSYHYIVHDRKGISPR